MHWDHVLRWLHVLAASAWWGEVVVINVILIPAMTSRPPAERRAFLNDVFPRVFRMASVTSATAVITGAARWV